jgi:hypothetical protein
MITINMSKAVKIKQDQIRAERKPLLDELDVKFMRAVESGNATLQAEIAAKKQALRDCTQDPAVVNATTPEELKAARPAALAS